MTRGSFRIQVEPVHVEDNRLCSNWRWLTVYDINGAAIHITMLHEKDIPQEVAIAIERAIACTHVGIRTT